MKAVWDRIHAWLDENAPPGYGHLRPGASAKAIRAAEKAMGLTLPDDVKESYGIHDGQGNEPGLLGGEGWCLLSLREMVKSWRQWSRLNPKGTHLVPIAWGGMGDYVLLNLRPGAKDCGRLIIQRHDRSKPDPFMPSFAYWLEDFAGQLEDGELAYSEEEGALMYADEMDFD
jgi:cell wall assembly regulator SMI1